MAEPEYGRHLQALADYLGASIPRSAEVGVVRAEFHGELRTDLEVWYENRDGVRKSTLVPDPILDEFADVARGLRKELARAGNPRCKAFVFTFTSGGETAVDVEY